ncbi:MAG: hypothetical protein U0457_05370 [Candidatus Sericytochromatia bacterium]
MWTQHNAGPATAILGGVTDVDTATRWQLDDVSIKAKGYSRGEMIYSK